MGWQVGFDSTWNRDIGYGVPATCDRPDCGEAIDRGLGYVCGSEPYGGEHGCGLYFCGAHLVSGRTASASSLHADDRWLCERCLVGKASFDPTPDTAEWAHWKLTDESWAEWRRQNPGETERIKALAGAETTP